MRGAAYAGSGPASSPRASHQTRATTGNRVSMGRDAIARHQSGEDWRHAEDQEIRRADRRRAAGHPAALRRQGPADLRQDPRLRARHYDGDERRANQAAFAALKHTHEKVGDHWEPKDEYGPSDDRAAGSLGTDAPTAGGVDANASKKHLYELASKLEIKGRSSMTKDELVDGAAAGQRPGVGPLVAARPVRRLVATMPGFAGACVAVTGAAGGIGLATCSWLSDHGASVYALDLHPAADQVGTFLATDVTDPASVRAAAAEVHRRAGRVDGLVAGAGIAEDDVAAEAMEIATFDHVLGVNLRGVFLSCQAFGRIMLEQGAGRIVAISSMSGNHIVNDPQRQCAYNASKAGVTALVKSLAVEWGPRGVRVNAVAPGYVDTPLTARKQALHERWKDGSVLPRFAAPAEIAAAIGYLLSDEAAFCCGTELLIDGGYSLR